MEQDAGGAPPAGDTGGSLSAERLTLVRAGAGRRSALLLFLALFAFYCAGIGLPSRPGSDLRPSEAHVLLTTQSLVNDGDFELRDDYRAAAWSDFYDGRLTPNALAVDGRLVEVQGLAFPALLAPAYAIGGKLAVQLFLAAIMALAFVLAAALGRRLVPDPWASGAALAVGRLAAGRDRGDDHHTGRNVRGADRGRGAAGAARAR